MDFGSRNDAEMAEMQNKPVPAMPSTLSTAGETIPPVKRVNSAVETFPPESMLPPQSTTFAECAPHYHSPTSTGPSRATAAPGSTQIYSSRYVNEGAVAYDAVHAAGASPVPKVPQLGTTPAWLGNLGTNIRGMGGWAGAKLQEGGQKLQEGGAGTGTTFVQVPGVRIPQRTVCDTPTAVLTRPGWQTWQSATAAAAPLTHRTQEALQNLKEGGANVGQGLANVAAPLTSRTVETFKTIDERTRSGVGQIGTRRTPHHTTPCPHRHPLASGSVSFKKRTLQ